MDLSLQGKRALVCGSSQGIGRATALELAELGADVTLFARDAAKLEQVRAELPGSGHSVLTADFTDPDAVKAAVSGAGSFHILVNNTGGPPGGPAHQAEPAAYEATFRQHLIVNHVLVRALIPGMREAGYGRIINVISTSVKEPIRDLGVSNTVRGAVANWAKTLAGELGTWGITVNNVLPGFTATQRLDYIFDTKAQKTGKPRNELEAAALGTVPLGRFAKPSEVAAAIAFLASPAASYITGINLPVDGGRTGSL